MPRENGLNSIEERESTTKLRRQGDFDMAVLATNRGCGTFCIWMAPVRRSGCSFCGTPNPVGLTNSPTTGIGR